MPLTPALTRIASVHFDERPHEWRTVYDQRGYPQLVVDILTPPPADSPHWVRGHRMITVGERPHDPAATEIMPMLLVALGTVRGATVGAAYFRQVDQAGVTGWITVNPRPIAGAPELVLGSQGWNHFPAAAVLDGGQFRTLVTDYLATGQRPESVSWQEAGTVL